MPRTLRDPAGAELLATLENTFAKYLALDAGLPLVLALWTLATHVFDCFDAFPYLAITSPTKRCGKTRLAEVVDMLACNGLRTVGATPAVIFRSIQMRTVDGSTLTLIIDEAEDLGTKSDNSDALRQILNAGYRRGQSVLRCERNGEKSFEVKSFNTYCPKVIVLIGNLPDTLADRCIAIAMRRRRQDEKVERFLFSHVMREAKRYRRDSEDWAKTNRTKVKRRHLRYDLEFLEDREAELWLPLFSVCAVVSPDRLEHLKTIALRISGAKQADEPAELGLLLLRDIRGIFARSLDERLPTTNLLLDLKTLDESPWSAWSHGASLDARGLARLLRPFKIFPHNLRLEDWVGKGYERQDFEEAWAMYLPLGPSATPLQGP